MSETIQRYYPLCGIHCEPCMGESQDGMYVDYADHLAALAAARREVETVTREREEARKMAALIEGSESRRTEERDAAEAIVAHARALVFAKPTESLQEAIERVNDGVLWLKDQHNQATVALTTARAALEDVRRVEAFMRDDECSVIVLKNGTLSASEWVDDGLMGHTVEWANAKDIVSLGRALAQEAG